MRTGSYKPYSTKGLLNPKPTRALNQAKQAHKVATAMWVAELLRKELSKHACIEACQTCEEVGGGEGGAEGEGLGRVGCGGQAQGCPRGGQEYGKGKRGVGLLT